LKCRTFKLLDIVQPNAQTVDALMKSFLAAGGERKKSNWRKAS
jgi:hypothetical protein